MAIVKCGWWILRKHISKQKLHFHDNNATQVDGNGLGSPSLTSLHVISRFHADEFREANYRSVLQRPGGYDTYDTPYKQRPTASNS